MKTVVSDNPLFDPELDLEKKLNLLVNTLTLDEKFHMLSSGSKGIERLGIPDCQLGGEAAHGVVARNWKDGEIVKDITTSFPQPIGMSSSWDKKAIYDAGKITGEEAGAVYSRRLWGGISRWAPTVDLLRDPRWGRNEEAYGEDPVQVGAMASSYIRGMQGEDKDHIKCAATLKHFYANNTEIGRGWKNSSVSPRNKYELYIEPFRRCIEDGGAEGVMASYNRINGVQGMFNREIKDLLKDEFGVSHVVSDGGAMELCAAYSHSAAMDSETAARSIKAGVDAISGWPDGVYAAVSEAYELGLLTEDDLDTAIKNVYRTKIRLGILDAGRPDENLCDPCSDRAFDVCKDITDRSIVLLKNDGFLPLDADHLKKTALIGPVGDKWYQDWYGGEAPEHISLLDGIAKIQKDSGCTDEMIFEDGCDRITLKSGKLFLSADEEGRVRLKDHADIFVLEDWGEGSYTLRSERTGKYLSTRLCADAIEGIAAAESRSADTNTISGKVYADSDRIFSWFDLEVFRMDEVTGGDVRDKTFIMRDRFGNRLYSDKDGYVVTAKEDYPGLTPLSFIRDTVKSGIDEAVSIAQKADTVILALGHNPMVNSKEEIDRGTINFIPYQQKLFDEIYKVNPDIAVVLMSDYPFAINEIDEKAKAIIWSATGSQCMGQSIADALTGSVHPSGRLTQTWYRSDEDIPDIDDYDIIGKDRTYRYFKGNVLYPFGYGLTYSSFAYGDLNISTERIDNTDKVIAGSRVFGQPEDVYGLVRRDNRALRVKVTVTNTGSMVSDEVVQIYAKAPLGLVKKPVRQLIGFERVRDIEPGESRAVTLIIPVRELAYYDVARESLIIEEGDYLITAASSSSCNGPSEVIHLSGLLRGVRDMTRKIKADHYDEESGSQIVEGLYGFSALTSAAPGVYDPVDGHFKAVYRDCRLCDKAGNLRIHGYAPADTVIRIFVDDTKAGEIVCNTRDYEKNPSEARNRMPRAVESENKRQRSLPVLWADLIIPLDLSGIIDNNDQDVLHKLVIDVSGPFKYDWFTMI